MNIVFISEDATRGDGSNKSLSLAVIYLGLGSVDRVFLYNGFEVGEVHDDESVEMMNIGRDNSEVVLWICSEFRRDDNIIFLLDIKMPGDDDWGWTLWAAIAGEQAIVCRNDVVFYGTQITTDQKVLYSKRFGLHVDRFKSRVYSQDTKRVREMVADFFAGRLI